MIAPSFHDFYLSITVCYSFFFHLKVYMGFSQQADKLLLVPNKVQNLIYWMHCIHIVPKSVRS